MKDGIEMKPMVEGFALYMYHITGRVHCCCHERPTEPYVAGEIERGNDREGCSCSNHITFWQEMALLLPVVSSVVQSAKYGGRH